jgi:hypothetical protein
MFMLLRRVMSQIKLTLMRKMTPLKTKIVMMRKKAKNLLIVNVSYKTLTSIIQMIRHTLIVIKMKTMTRWVTTAVITVQMMISI